jgi:A/G-specific adenine glycosylase
MTDFSLLITNWYRLNKRELPWRQTSDPYLIWLSEIILQQTRVDQGLSYYLKFAKNYPSINDLANAEEVDLLNDWQGLGYYSRARNLHYSAKLIRDDHNGIFPSDYTEILKLKGVGRYTAAAVASLAFGQNKAVVDGNVYRVLSRVYNISTPIDSTLGIKEFQSLADALIDSRNPGDHNQAIMEIGAIICTPKPKCDICPLNEICLGRANGKITELPVKGKKTKVRNRYFHFLIFSEKSQVLIEKRDKKGIWQNLYQFPLIETSASSNKELESVISNQYKESEEIIHLLSHQKIHAKFHHFDSIPSKIEHNWLKIDRTEIQNYPLPRVIDRYLEENTI